MGTSRRSFLKGLAAALVAANAMPLKVVGQLPGDLWYKEWLAAIAPIYSDYISNIMIWGVGALKEVDDFPYIRAVSPYELFQDLDDPDLLEARKNSSTEFGKTLIYQPIDGRLKGLYKDLKGLCP